MPGSVKYELLPNYQNEIKADSGLSYAKKPVHNSPIFTRSSSRTTIPIKLSIYGLYIDSGNSLIDCKFVMDNP